MLAIMMLILELSIVQKAPAPVLIVGDDSGFEIKIDKIVKDYQDESL